MVAIDRAVVRKSIAARIAGSMEPRFIRLAERASRSARERRGVRLNDDTRCSAKEVTSSTDVGGDNRQSGPKRLQEDDGEPLIRGGNREDVCDRHEIQDLVVASPWYPPKPRSTGHCGGEPAPLRTLSDHHGVEFLPRGCQVVAGREE